MQVYIKTFTDTIFKRFINLNNISKKNYEQNKYDVLRQI